jgi:homoserine O-acetyltransferase
MRLSAHRPRTSTDSSLPPASAAWREGDDPGDRKFVTLAKDTPFPLETGGSLAPLRIAYETWGELDPDRQNAVLVLHALTGDSHAAGSGNPGHPERGWWDGVIGPGGAIDSRRWFVVCPNVLGGCQGTTGPSSLAPDGRPYGSRFPLVTVRDQVAAEVALAETLGIDRWAAVIGGSMGAMRALEWAVAYPDRVRSAVLLATGAYASAEQIALCAMQVRAIRSDTKFKGGDYYDSGPGEGPHEGMGLARRIGHLSYRSELELDERFGRDAQHAEDPFEGGRYAVESYLDHHADKLVRRFDANSYIVLSEAMNHHDVGRGRGDLASALANVTADVTIAGIDSDRLYPLRFQEELAALLPARPEVTVVPSFYGHDGFLIETDRVGKVIRESLDHLERGEALVPSLATSGSSSSP